MRNGITASINPQTVHEWGEIIRTEPNPFLREIWDARYTHIFEDGFAREIVLIHESGETKRIDSRRWMHELQKMKTKKGIMPDGTIHEWIAEGDGSADAFRNLISRSDFK